MIRRTIPMFLAMVLIGPGLGWAQFGFQIQPKYQSKPAQKPQNPPLRVQVQQAPPRKLNVQQSQQPRRTGDAWRWIPGLLPQEPGVAGQEVYEGTPLSRSSAPGAPQRVEPSEEQLAALSHDQLREVLSAAVESLDDALARTSAADGWKKFLDTETLRGLFSPEHPVPPDEGTRDTLGKIAERFERTAGTPEYRMIAEKQGFATLRGGLKEYAAEPLTRAKRGLASQVARLDEQIRQDWKEALLTGELARVATNQEALQPGDVDVLKKAKKQFDAVAQNENYQVISKLDAFRATRRQIDATLVTASPRLLAEQRDKEVDKDRIREVLGGLFGHPEPSPNKVLQLLAEEADQAEVPDKARVAEVLRGLFGSGNKRPEELNPAEAKILQHIVEEWHKAQQSPETKGLRDLPSFAAAHRTVTDRAVAYNRLQAAWSRRAMGFLLPGSQRNSRAPGEILTLKPDTGQASGKVLTLVPPEATILPLGVDRPPPPDATILPLGVEDDDQPPAATLLQFGDDPPSGATLLQFSDQDQDRARPRAGPMGDRHLSIARHGRSLTVENLNRWLDPEALPWIDAVLPEAADGHAAGSKITLAGHNFSPDAARITIEILKRTAGGSIGTLAAVTPQMVVGGGTALELELPVEAVAGNYLVRAVVASAGQSLPSNVVALDVARPPLPPPVLTRISPNPQSPFKMLTVAGQNFGDAGFIELWFQRPDAAPLRTGDRAAAANKPLRRAFAQVVGDQQLYAQVPLHLAAGPYLVAANRQGRLSNWLPLTIVAGPADLAVIELQVQQRWWYTSHDVAKLALDRVAEADKLREYWYQVRAIVKNVGSTDSPDGRTLQVGAVRVGESAGTREAIGQPIAMPALAPGDLWATEWIETPHVFRGLNRYSEFTARITPADANGDNDVLANAPDSLRGDERP